MTPDLLTKSLRNLFVPSHNAKTPGDMWLKYLKTIIKTEDAMKKNIAQAIQVEPARINIKATTTEGLGMIGEGDGIGAMCIVLISGEQRA